VFWLKNYGDEVRGCTAIQDIEEDEVIVEIPLQCLITVEMGKETDVSIHNDEQYTTSQAIY
jgi:hypothetical protein